MRALSELKILLTSSPITRKTGIINKNLFDFLFNKEFGVPLDVLGLPNEDPLKKLSDIDSISLAISKDADTFGAPYEVKKELLEVMTSHLRGSSTALKVPSSFFMIGKPETGKTEFLLRVFKKAGMPLYDFSKVEGNEEAMVFFVNTPSIVEGIGGESDNLDSPELKPMKGGVLSIRQLELHLDHFLTLPNGYRGAIIYDDLHKASNEKILERLLTKNLAILHPASGFYLAESVLSGEEKRIAVKNLIHGAVVNYSNDKSIIEKYSVEDTEDNVRRMVLASLAWGERPLDESLPSRVNKIIEWNSFIENGKSSALLSQYRSSTAADVFSSEVKLNLLLPSAAWELEGLLGDAGAREFIVQSTSSLQKMLFRPNPPDNGPSFSLIKKNSVDNSDKRQKIGSFDDDVKKRVKIVDVHNEGYYGQLSFLSLVLDQFRTQLYEKLGSTINSSSIFNNNLATRQSIGIPLLLSLSKRHSSEPSVPLQLLGLNSVMYGTFFSNPGFEKNVKEVSPSNPDMFLPIDIDQGKNFKPVSGYQSPDKNLSFSRLDVLSNYSYEIGNILGELFQVFFRVEDLQLNPEKLSDYPKTQDWLDVMEVYSESLIDQNVAKKMNNILSMYSSFRSDINEKQIRGKDGKSLTVYDINLLFLYVLDHSISKLPWVPGTRFLSKNLWKASSDIGLGQSSALKDYLFTADFSPFNMRTGEILDQFVHSSVGHDIYDHAEYFDLEDEFYDNCSDIFSLGSR